MTPAGEDQRLKWGAVCLLGMAFLLLVPWLLGDMATLTQDNERDLFRAIDGAHQGPPLGPFGIHLGPLYYWLLKPLLNPFSHVWVFAALGALSAVCLFAATRSIVAVVALLGSETLIQTAMITRHSSFAPLLEALIILGVYALCHGRLWGAYLAAVCAALEAQLLVFSYPGLGAALIVLIMARKTLGARHIAGVLITFVVGLLPMLLTQDFAAVGGIPAHKAATYSGIDSALTLMVHGLGVFVDGLAPVAWTCGLVVLAAAAFKSDWPKPLLAFLAADVLLTGAGIAVAAGAQIKITYTLGMVVSLAALAGAGAPVLWRATRARSPWAALAAALIILPAALSPAVERRLPLAPLNLAEQHAVVSQLRAWGVDKQAAATRVHGTFRGYLSAVWFHYHRQEAVKVGQEAALDNTIHMAVLPDGHGVTFDPAIVVKRTTLAPAGRALEIIAFHSRVTVLATAPCAVAIPFAHHPLCAGRVPDDCRYIRQHCETQKDQLSVSVESSAPFVVQLTAGCGVSGDQARFHRLPVAGDHSRARWQVTPLAPQITLQVGPCPRIRLLDIF